MQIRYFSIRAIDPADEAIELNRFLASHRVIEVNEQLVVNGGSSYWVVSVHWLESNRPGGVSSSRNNPRVDYKEVLDEEEFVIYAALRERRKTLAEQNGVKVYTVFTNAQLAEMVSNRVTGKSGLESIAGVGESRINQYGDAMLEVLRKHIGELKTDSHRAPDDL